MKYKICTRWLKMRDQETAAAFLFENGIVTIFSWFKDSLFDGEQLFLTVSVPEDTMPLFNNQTFLRK